jgi:hypothetical protein
MKIFCDEAAIIAQIDLITELELCVYEFHILSNTVCNIPNFSKKPNNLNIFCNPVVSPAIYEKYTKRKEAKATKETQQALIDLLTQKLSLKETDEDPVVVEVEEESTEDTSSSLTEETTIIEDDSTELDEIYDALEQHQENLDFIGKNEKLDALNEQLKADLAQTEDTISTLKENAKKFEQIVRKVKKESENGEPADPGQTQEQIAEAQNVLASSVDKFVKNEELFNKITQRLNDIIDEFEGTPKQVHDQAEEELTDNRRSAAAAAEEESSVSLAEDDPNNWKMKVTVIDPNDFVNNQENTAAEMPDEKLSELEKTLSERLSKSEKLVEKFKTSNIKVKIITLDKTETGELKQIGDAESEGLSALISSLFENNKQKQQAKRLKANYRHVYTEENIDKVAMPGLTDAREQNEYEADEEEDGELFDTFDDQFTLEPNENENDKELIVY